MSGRHGLEVLARLRRAGMDGTRQALAQASQALAAAEAASAGIWTDPALTDPGRSDPAMVDGNELGWRSCLLEAGRRRAEALADEVARLRRLRQGLEEQVARELLACRQVELVLEGQRRARRAERQAGQQRLSDEMAARGSATER